MCLGWLLLKMNTSYVRIARININLVFPDLTSEKIDELLHQHMSEYGKLVFEMAFNWLIPTDLFKESMCKIYGQKFFEQALEEGRGIVLVQLHISNWEIYNQLVGSYRPYALYRPANNRVIDNVVKKSRERPGTVTVPFTTAGVRKLYHVLQEGGIIKAFPDQLPDGKGKVVVDFLGVPARTGTLLPRLIQKIRPAVLCCYVNRLPWARGYELHIARVSEEVYDEDIKQSAAAINRSMELAIRSIPEQYLWGYKRYKYTVDPELYSRNSPVQ